MHNFNRLGASHSLTSNWPIYILVLTVYGTGVLLGFAGVSAMPPEQTTGLQDLLHGFLTQAHDLNINQPRMATLALHDYFFWGAAMYLLGLTVICLPLILLFVFSQGFTLGFTISYLTQNIAGQGLAVLLVSLLPQNMLFIPAIIIGGAASVSFSVLLLRRFFNSQTKIWPRFVGYTSLMVGVMILLALTALTEVYITPAITQLVASFFVY